MVSRKHEYKLPATACILQYRLGITQEVAAYDVSLGCSAYPYALFIAIKCKSRDALQCALYYKPLI
ncbi:hypothetical protein CQA66_08765 [Helicobacter aurati]|uniref:Uncharacterized protein n=1 Tax=Helicobacter aurati TaxID=137778 RepID=A0A3D8IYX5_9HELI|nr:hypothetical protein [Helicobacter aurati]RDU69824.1 hypothetical protein CQA66_08765 [Helicobacter aurati]